jgi:hypothetical protein
METSLRRAAPIVFFGSCLLVACEDDGSALPLDFRSTDTAMVADALVDGFVAADHRSDLAFDQSFDQALSNNDFATDHSLPKDGAFPDASLDSSADLPPINPLGPSLEVSPAEIYAPQGDPGGPFEPATKSYTLTNGGGQPLSFVVGTTPAWLLAAPSSGTLAPGGTIQLILGLGPGASGLAVGSYAAAAMFQNTTNGKGNTTRATIVTVNNVGTTGWKAYAGNPVYGSGSLDAPSLIKLPGGGGYRLWYAVDHQSVFSATSPDGVNWIPDGSGPVFGLGAPGAWDSSELLSLQVVDFGPTLLLYYAARAGAGAAAIGRASSTDGLNWTRSGNNPLLTAGASGSWDDVSVSDPTVLENAGVHQMWYSGTGSGLLGIGYATSADGLGWQRVGTGPVLVGSATAPRVIKDGSIYRMWYLDQSVSGGAVAAARSADAVVWVPYVGNPIYPSGATGAWDDTLGRFHLIKDGLIFRLWYIGSSSAPSTYLGYASSAP